MVLPTTLTMASARWPRRLASRNAASVSAVSPDCEMAEQHGVFFERRVAVTKFVRELDFDRNVREFLDQIFADERRVPARAAGGDDDAVDGRNSAGVMFRPPNFAVASFRSMRPRKAFSTVRGCSKISLSMKCAYLPRSASSWLNSRLLIWTLAVSVPRFKTSKRSGVMVATS